MKQSVLVVDDEPGIRESLTSVLQDEGYEVASVGSGEACLESLPANKFDAVLLDIWLPGMDGIQVLEKIQAMEDPPTVIMISGHGTIDTAVRSTKLGAFDFIEKPLSIDKTLLTLRHALEQSRLTSQNRDLRAELHGRDRIIGDSVPMKALRQQLQLAAPTNGRVLIYGESGTGKELVAHALHNNSQRADQPFVEVNCAARNPAAAPGVGPEGAPPRRESLPAGLPTFCARQVSHPAYGRRPTTHDRRGHTRLAEFQSVRLRRGPRRGG